MCPSNFGCVAKDRCLNGGRQTKLYSIGVYLDVQTVVETPAFLDDVRSLRVPDSERLAIVTWIAGHPDAGKVIEGTGGARKVRFAGKGKGKSGGYCEGDRAGKESK